MSGHRSLLAVTFAALCLHCASDPKTEDGLPASGGAGAGGAQSMSGSAGVAGSMTSAGTSANAGRAGRAGLSGGRQHAVRALHDVRQNVPRLAERRDAHTPVVDRFEQHGAGYVGWRHQHQRQQGVRDGDVQRHWSRAALLRPLPRYFTAHVGGAQSGPVVVLGNGGRLDGMFQLGRRADPRVLERAFRVQKR